PEARRPRRRPPPRPGRLADAPGQPAAAAGDGQPPLAVALRPGHRRLAERLRRDGREADAPGSARLAGLRAARHWLAEAAARADRAVESLPAGVAAVFSLPPGGRGRG